MGRRVSSWEFTDALIANGLRPGTAYRATHPGVKPESAWSQGAARLRSGIVLRELERRFGGLMKQFEVTEERLIQEAACLAFLDPADLFDEDGAPLPIQEIPEEARRTIAGIDINDIWKGPPGNKVYCGTLKRFKVGNKLQAIEFLAKIKQLLLTKVEVSASNDLADMLAEARGRVARRKTIEESFFS